jgi:hypothetical protein
MKVEADESHVRRDAGDTAMCDLVHIRSPLLRDERYAEKDFGSTKGATP